MGAPRTSQPHRRTGALRARRLRPYRGRRQPAGQPKYGYWTGGPPVGNIDGWLEKSEQHPGSWWPDWLEWIKAQDPAEVPARAPGGGKYAALEDAPGSYVRVRS